MSSTDLPMLIGQSYTVAAVSPAGSLALLGTSSISVIGFSQSRRGIIFINSGTVTITLVPSNQTAVAGQGVVVLPQGQVSFLGNDSITFNCGWNGIAESGSGNPLQILELI